MHPPLDRPHPDCQDVIAQLQHCHQSWKKFFGVCNTVKMDLDQCFRDEKRRLQRKLEAEVPERRSRQEKIIKHAFGKDETWQEYLEKDREHRQRQAK